MFDLNATSLGVVTIFVAAGCLADGCIASSILTGTALKLPPRQMGVLFASGHFIYESIGILVGAYLDKRYGIFAHTLASVGLLFLIFHLIRHLRHEHCHQEHFGCDHVHTPINKIKANQFKMLGVPVGLILASSQDAFFFGLSIPTVFDNYPSSLLLLSALCSALILGYFTFLGMKGIRWITNCGPAYNDIIHFLLPRLALVVTLTMFFVSVSGIATAQELYEW
jgi:hypothetical protein